MKKEFTGKTTQEAIDKGLSELGVTIADVQVDVLQEGAKGLFGFFGSKPARVLITLKEEEAPEEDLHIHWSLDSDRPAQKKPAKAEKKPQEKAERRGAEPKAQEQTDKEKKAPEKKPAEKTREKNAEEADAREAQAKKPARPQPEKKAESAGETAESAKAPRERKPKQTARRPQKQTAERAERREPMPPAQAFAPSEPPVLFDEGTPAGAAQRFLMDLTEKMGVQVAVYVEESREGVLSLRLIGDTLGILIGRRGETLDALQYLTSLRVNKGNEDYIRVTLDTENYRAKREDSLRRYAVRMANRAQKTGRRVVVEPMNPYERRIMHTALQDHPAVETHSEGEEPNRRVVITLKARQPEEEETQEETAQEQEKRPAKRSRRRHRSRKPRAAAEQAANGAEAAESAANGETAAPAGTGESEE